MTRPQRQAVIVIHCAFLRVSCWFTAFRHSAGSRIEPWRNLTSRRASLLPLGRSMAASRLRSPLSQKQSLRRRTVLATGGRLVIRPSGTETVIRVMGEAYDKALVNSLVADVCDAVTRAV